MDIKLGGLEKAAVLLDEDKVNNGVWVHLESAETDPETGQTWPLYAGEGTDKPIRAKVRSYRCKQLKDLEASRQKTGFVKIRVAKKKERDGVIAENAIIPEDERFSYLLVALENFGEDGGVQQVSEADAKTMHGMTSLDDIVAQIREAAYDDELYLATPATPAGKSSGSTMAPKPLTTEPPAGSQD